MEDTGKFEARYLAFLETISPFGRGFIGTAPG
jgi:hypothetical protein